MDKKKKEQMDKAGFDMLKGSIKETFTEEPKETKVDTKDPTPESKKKKKVAQATDPKKERKMYSEEEAKKLISELKTRGRKGLGLSRLNIAFTDENIIFIKTMSNISGLTITEFMNRLVEEAYEENKDVFQSAMKIRKKFAPSTQED